MKPTFILLPAVFLPAGLVSAALEVTTEASAEGFKFEDVPAPATNDAATGATFTLVDGRRDGNGGELAVLHDGEVPAGDDQPDANFFLAAGTEAGRVSIDLGEVADVESIATYSRHDDARGPQVYTVYTANGVARNFEAEPKLGTDPEKVGWKRLAEVDTREAGDGATHGVLIGDGTFGLGDLRYILFDISPTETRDAFGNTFFSEIDVVRADGPEPERIKPPEKIRETFTSADGEYRYIVDATRAPDLMPWVKEELMPVVEEWYPKMIAMLPSEGYTAPETVFMEFKTDMGGTPAYAAGNRLSLSVPFFRDQLEGEAKGCVVHELVHVIQNYWRARRTNPDPKPTPGWVTEGVADYIRWFLYEPESRGARIHGGNIDRARYDASYRTTANFLDWVIREHDGELLEELNAAAREGRYSEEFWEERTGESVENLGELWLEHHRERIEESS